MQFLSPQLCEVLESFPGISALNNCPLPGYLADATRGKKRRMLAHLPGAPFSPGS